MGYSRDRTFGVNVESCEDGFANLCSFHFSGEKHAIWNRHADGRCLSDGMEREN